MSDEPVIDDEFDFQFIALAVLQNNFDLDKAAKQLKASKWPIGRNLARIRDALTRWETHITNLERTTRNPEDRLAYRRMLAHIRKTRHPPNPAGEPNEEGIDFV